MTFFTADLHLGHKNIIEFCNRPFKDVEHMNKRLIANINERCKPTDTLYHLGDFAFTSGQQGTPINPQQYEEMINCKVIHIMGNHDKNNSLRRSIRYAELHAGGYRLCLQHKPPEILRCFPGATEQNEVYLVGHVHQLWTRITIKGRLVINMGTDVWDYYPKSLPEIIKHIQHSEEIYNGIV